MPQPTPPVTPEVIARTCARALFATQFMKWSFEKGPEIPPGVSTEVVTLGGNSDDELVRMTDGGIISMPLGHYTGAAETFSFDAEDATGWHVTVMRVKEPMASPIYIGAGSHFATGTIVNLPQEVAAKAFEIGQDLARGAQP